MKYGDYLGTAISQHMTSKYLTKSLTHLLQARIVEVIMYDCPVLVSSARSSISKPLIEIHIFESNLLIERVVEWYSEEASIVQINNACGC